MATTQQQVATAPDGPVAMQVLRSDLEKMRPQFEYALPAHIPVARFERIVLSAVQRNPKLHRCSRQSFFNACMSAAQDGLLPDGREGAIVPYSDDGSDQAQWLPMIRGIRKLVRNAGVLTDWNVQVVQEGDQFDYQLGDDPYIAHKPAPRGGRGRPVLFAYSIATYPDGTKSREVMNIDQLEDVRKKSKARKGPWSDPTFYPEMCRKTVAKLHAKQLPMSTDLDTLLRRDDELYDLKGASDRARQPQRAPTSVSAALDHFGGAPRITGGESAGAAGGQVAARSETSAAAQTISDNGRDPGAGDDDGDVIDQATGEVTDQQARSEEAQGKAALGDDPNKPQTPSGELAGAWSRGKEDRARGMSKKALPPELRETTRTAEAAAWMKGWEGEAL